MMFNFKRNSGITIFSFAFLIFINPINVFYRQVRYSLIFTFFHVIAAPFGAVKFKAYLLAEILSESVIQLEDIGKCIAYIATANWDGHLANMTQGSLADKHFHI